jgi:hypothetical protein
MTKLQELAIKRIKDLAGSISIPCPVYTLSNGWSDEERWTKETDEWGKISNISENIREIERWASVLLSS